MEDNACTKNQTRGGTDLSASQCALESQVMSVVMNHPFQDVQEVIKGHNVKHGTAHFVPERCLSSTDGKSPSSDRFNNQVLSSKRTQTSTTGTPLSPSSSLPVTLSGTTPLSNFEGHKETLVRINNSCDGTSRNVQTDVNNGSLCRPHLSEDSSSSDFEASKTKTGVIFSTPINKSAPPGSQQALPLGPSKLSRIRQSHLASKKREQMKNRCTKLPELEENSELDTVNINLTQASTNDSHTVTEMSQIISITNDNVPSATTDDVVVPSISETFLNKLGLSIQCSSIADDVSVEQLPEKDIESKFVSLSLAFKTDKLTLDQRVSVQERSRDLAEKNVDTELQDLRENVESLSELVADAQVRGVLQKIKQHINVLEQFAAKVSSRAEVYGAVQQERRMCKAMEVMVLYTENLRRIREKEESELREARKLLNERCGNGFRVDSDSGSNRRSMSVCGLNAVGRPMRRRSEVALPRIIGGVGSPSMTQTANLEHVLPFSKSSFISAISRKSTEGEDPKSRFQSAVASTTMQHVVTSTMRKCSVEKQRSTSLSSVSSLSPPLIPTSEELQFTSSSSLSVNNEQENLSESQSDKLQMVITNSQEEEAFRKGFREGLKTKLSQELNDLRDQQNSISQILEHVMDKVDTTDNEDNEYMPSPSLIETVFSMACGVRDHVLKYEWRSNKTVIRNLTGVTFILLAFVIIFLCPPISSVKVGHFVKPS